MKKLREIHLATSEPAPYSLALSGVLKKMAKVCNAASVDLVVYMQNGDVPRRRVTGSVPPPHQDDVCRRLCASLNLTVGQEEPFSWAVVLGEWSAGAWNPEAPERPGAYDKTFMLPIDREGDVPFVMLEEHPPAIIEAGMGNLLEQASTALGLYNRDLGILEVKPEHTIRAAMGETAGAIH